MNSRWCHDYLCLKELNNTMVNFSHTLNPDKKYRILDVGCGEKPYYELFEPYAMSYTGIDVIDGSNVDIVANNEDLPFEDSSFDLILCNQVLEHTAHPDTAVNEMHRVLSAGGIAIISVPGIWNKHGVYDYWRWTDDGVRRLLHQFSSVEVIPNGGSLVCLFQFLNFYAVHIPLVNKPVSFILNILGDALGSVDNNKDYLIINYTAVARKAS